MAYESIAGSSLDYFPCRYGSSKIMFRGPKRNLDAPFVAVLGGTETYGRFMEHPYPNLLEAGLGCVSVNFGCPNAGLDVFANDQTLLDACNRARAVVIQVPGAQNMSNRLYAVHPRRNDRFLRASNLLKSIYQDIDFTEINFTRHLLTQLEASSADNFELVRQELHEAWVGRMKTLISRLSSKIILLWMSDHSIQDGGQQGINGTDPLFVDAKMMNEVRPFVHSVTEVVVTPQEMEDGHAGLVFSDMEEPAVEQMLGTVAHERASAELARKLAPLI